MDHYNLSPIPSLSADFVKKDYFPVGVVTCNGGCLPAHGIQILNGEAVHSLSCVCDNQCGIAGIVDKDVERLWASWNEEFGDISSSLLA